MVREYTLSVRVRDDIGVCSDTCLASTQVYAEWRGHQGTVVERLARVRYAIRNTPHRPTRLALFRKAVADIVYGDTHWTPQGEC